MKIKKPAWFERAVRENLFEGFRLNLFGGSFREVVDYLKSINQKNSK
ncbi:MAG: hypothetical protein ACI3XL_06575 [Eubacteriales bacterium]